MGETKKKPARTSDERERRIASLAMDRLEERLMNGTATSQEIIYCLKLVDPKSKLEKKKLAADTKLSIAKAEDVTARRQSAELAEEAFEAFKRYAGNNFNSGDDSYYED